MISRPPSHTPPPSIGSFLLRLVHRNLAQHSAWWLVTLSNRQNDEVNRGYNALHLSSGDIIHPPLRITARNLAYHCIFDARRGLLSTALFVPLTLPFAR